MALTESVESRIDEDFTRLWLLARSIDLVNTVSHSIWQKNSLFFPCWEKAAAWWKHQKLGFYFQDWELPAGFQGVTTPLLFALASDFNYRCATRITIPGFLLCHYHCQGRLHSQTVLNKLLPPPSFSGFILFSGHDAANGMTTSLPAIYQTPCSHLHIIVRENRKDQEWLTLVS